MGLDIIARLLTLSSLVFNFRVFGKNIFYKMKGSDLKLYLSGLIFPSISSCMCPFLV
jgi:hypothetical protein